MAGLDFLANLFSPAPRLPSPDLVNRLYPTVGQVNQQMQQPELSNNALNAFMAAANNYPTRTPPNMLTKIGAAMAGFGGPTGLKMQDYLLNNKYDQQVQDYENRLKPLEFAANEEGQRNQTARLLAYNQQQNELNRNKLGVTAEHYQNQDLSSQQRNNIAAFRAEVARMKVEMPDYYFTTDEDSGKLVGINKNDPTDVKVFEVARPTEGSKFQNALKFEEVKQSNRKALEGTKQENRKELKSIPSASSSGKTQSYSDKLNQRKLNILEAMDKFPDLAQYITKNGADYVIPPLTGGMLSWFSNKTPEERQKIVDLIYPNDPRAQSLVGNKTETNSGKIHVRRKSDGQLGYMSAGAFNPDKYEKVP
jgi:hypothetical protein